jgi:putative transposase
MDERYLLACARYIEMNPVRAGLVTKPEKWSWSSAWAHMSGNDDKLVKTAPLLQMTGDKWKDFLNVKIREEEIGDIQTHEQKGRPLGSVSFVEDMEKTLGRLLKPKKAGRKPKDTNK